MTIKSKKFKLTPEQEKFKERDLPRPPEGLSKVALQLFKAAINKIQYIPVENGGLEINYSKLTVEELFAIDRGIFIPSSIKKKLQDTQPRLNLGELKVIINKTDSETIAGHERLMDTERKTILVTEHGEKFPQGRPPDAISESTQYIQKLVAEHPTKKAKELQRLADESIIQNMSSGTFANKVSKAKKSIKSK